MKTAHNILPVHYTLILRNITSNGVQSSLTGTYGRKHTLGHVCNGDKIHFFWDGFFCMRQTNRYKHKNLPGFWHNLAFPGLFHRLATEPPSSNLPQIHRPVWEMPDTVRWSNVDQSVHLRPSKCFHTRQGKHTWILCRLFLASSMSFCHSVCSLVSAELKANLSNISLDFTL